MKTKTSRLPVFLAGLVLPASLPAQSAPPPASGPLPDVTYEDIVVHGSPMRCHPRPGDPLDAVDVQPNSIVPAQQVIEPDPATGRLGLARDDDPITGPDYWQRAGTRLDQYVFRAPADGTPLCIGARVRAPIGWGQLRRVLDARPYYGKVVRFTAFVATRRAQRVIFWLAAGSPDHQAPHNIVSGSNSEQRPITGTHGWMPISYSVGPIECNADRISYGFLLEGDGDLWIDQPRFEEIPDAELPPNLVHGRQFLETNRICRRHRYGSTGPER